MAGRASIVAAAETDVGKVRDHNEDSHFVDSELGIFLVCDGMGGHAAGEVASAMAVEVIHDTWGSEKTQGAAERWLESGTPEARKALLAAVSDGVTAAHAALLAEAQRDRTKGGMGTTLVGALSVGGDVVFAHCGDSRAYLVRDGIAMQLTEDHTLLARLLAAGVDVDTSAEGGRFKSMLTNALGIGPECKVSTFVVPVADGDRFLLCSDGITEYIAEAEIGEVLGKQANPSRAAARLVELALERGGGDNATALVVRVLEAGETSRPAELLRKEAEAIDGCPLWAKVTPQQRLRALRIALPRDHADGERIPLLTLGDRVAWIIVEGEVEQQGVSRGPGSLLYPEALLAEHSLPDRDAHGVARGEVRTLALRSDDFRELCEDDPELGEVLLEALVAELAARGRGRVVVQAGIDAHSTTDPEGRALGPSDVTQRVHTPPTGVPRPYVQPERVSVTPPGGAPAPVPVPAPRVPMPARRVDKTPPGGSAIAPRAPRVPMPARTEKIAVTGANRPLFMPASERAATDAAVDRAMSKLLGDAVGDSDEPTTPLAALPQTAPAAPPVEAEAEEIVHVIEVDDERVDLPPVRPTPPPSRRLGQSEPEISIVALEMEADEPETVIVVEADDPEPAPRDEPSDPEIVVIKPGRAITADDTNVTAGTIEPDAAPEPRARARTNTPK